MSTYLVKTGRTHYAGKDRLNYSNKRKASPPSCNRRPPVEPADRGLIKLGCKSFVALFTGSYTILSGHIVSDVVTEVYRCGLQSVNYVTMTVLIWL